MMPDYAQGPSKITTTDLCIKQNKGMGDLDQGSSEAQIGVKPFCCRGSRRQWREKNKQYRQLF